MADQDPSKSKPRGRPSERKIANEWLSDVEQNAKRRRLVSNTLTTVVERTPLTTTTSAVRRRVFEVIPRGNKPKADDEEDWTEPETDYEVWVRVKKEGVVSDRDRARLCDVPKPEHYVTFPRDDCTPDTVCVGCGKKISEHGHDVAISCCPWIAEVY